jgi:hypothetical protein
MNQWMWAYIKPYVLQQLSQKMVVAQDNANNTNDDRVQQNVANA